MRITFQTNDISEAGKQNTNYHINGRKNDKAAKVGEMGMMAAYQADLFVENRNYFPGMEEEKEKSSSLKGIQQELSNINVAVQQDYMTVMSHTMSEEDFAKLSEDGFAFEQMDPETAVTIVDKIKAELARSGQVIVGYTDDLDVETLTQAVGSESLARAVADSFQRTDLPVSEDMAQEVRQAWDMASKLEVPTEGTYQYMVENGLEPEIEDFYLAENSGAQMKNVQGTHRNTGERMPGFEGMEEQVDKIIQSTGMEVNDRTRKAAYRLMEMELPITAENMTRLETLQNVVFPVTEEIFAQAVANAVAEGRRPVQADLSGRQNIYDKVAVVLDKYQAAEGWEQFSEDISARKLLEEVRLHMTAEVNIKLIKSGFAIDTAPMEELIEALKEAERQVAQDYFPGSAQAVDQYRLYHETNRVVQEIPNLPAQVIGPVAMSGYTISRIHQEGSAIREEHYRAASAGYEALMTAPRRDLGDSIQKAFANVDDIVEDMGLALTEKNRRAVRILGYNHMEITHENIERVAQADEQVQSLIRRMKPAATLQMIRDGINPLETSLEELENYFDHQSQNYDDSAESYSRFLHGLEKQGDISEEERSAYIGVYRMLYQIEHSDGAVVGALVNSQAELHFANLLSAVRSGKFKHLDVRAEDSFGTVAELIQKGESISDQIAKGFMQSVGELLQEVSGQEESKQEYYRERLQNIRNAANVSRDAAELLQRGEITCNAENLLAAQGLLEESALFKEIKDRLKREKAVGGQDAATQTESMTELLAESEEVLERMDDKESFRENYSRMMEQLSKEVQQASLQDADSSLDVRSLQMLNKQLNIVTKLADSEEYVLPMYIGENLTNVHLRVERGSSEKGGVHIVVNLSEESRLEAHFTLQNGKLGGFLIGNTEQEVRKLQSSVDIFIDYIRNHPEEMPHLVVGDLPVISSESNVMLRGGRTDDNSGREAGTVETDGADNKELYRIAKTFLQAIREEK